MKIVYGCYPHYMARCIANLLVRYYKLPITCILRSKKRLAIDGKKIKGIRGIVFLLKKFGPGFVFYRIVVITLLLPLLSSVYGFFNKKNRILSFEELAEKYNIELIDAVNFNKKKVRYLMEEKKFDLFLSMCLNQILKAKFIKIPERGSVNLHPSILPDFRGVDPIFQLMLTKENEMGISLHELAPEIDSGALILTGNVERKISDSHLRLYFKFVLSGVKIFADYVNQLSRGKKIDFLPQDESNIKYEYHSWPNKDEIKRFQKCGHKFFLFRELFGLLNLEAIERNIMK